MILDGRERGEREGGRERERGREGEGERVRGREREGERERGERGGERERGENDVKYGWSDMYTWTMMLSLLAASCASFIQRLTISLDPLPNMCWREREQPQTTIFYAS